MAAFIFSGDPNAPGKDPAECILFGMDFPFGVAVEVDDPETAERLRRHSHFTESFEGAAPVVKPRRGRPPKVRDDG